MKQWNQYVFIHHIHGVTRETFEAVSVVIIGNLCQDCLWISLCIMPGLCGFLARNDTHLSMAAELIRLRICPVSSNLVCNEGQRLSPCSSRQSLALFMEDSTNYCCQKQRHMLHSSSQIRKVAFTIFKHADIPVVKGAPRDVTMRDVRETTLASSTYASFT